MRREAPRKFYPRGVIVKTLKMGRSRKDSDDRKKKGTYRATEDKKMQKNNYKGYPDPGIELSDEQMILYRRICDHLKAKQALYDVDTFMIASYAVAVDTRNKAVEMMNKLGLIQEFDNGTRNISPEFSIFKKANEEMRQLSKMLGGDPRSRQDLVIFIEEGEPDHDPLADLMGEAPK